MPQPGAVIARSTCPGIGPLPIKQGVVVIDLHYYVKLIESSGPLAPLVPGGWSCSAPHDPGATWGLTVPTAHAILGRPGRAPGAAPALPVFPRTPPWYCQLNSGNGPGEAVERSKPAPQTIHSPMICALGPPLSSCYGARHGTPRRTCGVDSAGNARGSAPRRKGSVGHGPPT